MEEKVSQNNEKIAHRGPSPKGIVALCALKMEARALQGALKEVATLTKSGLIKSGCDDGPSEDMACEVFRCGIGPAASRRRTEEIIRRENPRLIVNFGLAGCLSPGHEPVKVWAIGELAVADYLCEARASADRKEYVPSLRCVKIAQELGFRPARMGSVAGTVQSAEERRRIYEQFGVELIDMEAFFISDAARKWGVDCVSLKVVSDFADDVTQSDFLKHAPKVISQGARQAAQVIRRLRMEGREGPEGPEGQKR